MPDALLRLLLAAAAFVLLHVGVAGSPLRAVLVRRLGKGYLGLFSLLSALALAAMIGAYHAAAAPGVNFDLWVTPRWALWLPFVGMPLALFLLVASMTTKSPTAVGAEALLAAPEPARGVLRLTRHPMLSAFSLWALLHLAANGDAASVVVFAAVLVVSVNGMYSIDRKRAAAEAEGWARFAGVTSRLPFAAIASGRNHLALAEIGAARPIAGLALWGLLLASHAWIYGASPLPW